MSARAVWWLVGENWASSPQYRRWSWTLVAGAMTPVTDGGGGGGGHGPAARLIQLGKGTCARSGAR